MADGPNMCRLNRSRSTPRRRRRTRRLRGHRKRSSRLDDSSCGTCHSRQRLKSSKSCVLPMAPSSRYALTSDPNCGNVQRLMVPTACRAGPHPDRHQDGQRERSRLRHLHPARRLGQRFQSSRRHDLPRSPPPHLACDGSRSQIGKRSRRTQEPEAGANGAAETECRSGVQLGNSLPQCGSLLGRSLACALGSGLLG